MRRVAVLGVPRGGTSMTVGLLRILGYRLPSAEWEPQCLTGESKRLRAVENPDEPSYEALAQRVMALPDGIVWKDPCVGEYAHLMDWSSWDVVTVHRPVEEVRASEERWTNPEWAQSVPERVSVWETAYLGSLVATTAANWTHVDTPWMRSNPMLAAAKLRQSLGLGGMEDGGARYALAADFIHDQESGYWCPLPGSCEVCKG
jgi:hypothetical protein